MNWATPRAPAWLRAHWSNLLSCQIKRAKKPIGRPWVAAAAASASQTSLDRDRDGEIVVVALLQRGRFAGVIRRRLVARDVSCGRRLEMCKFADEPFDVPQRHERECGLRLGLPSTDATPSMR